MAKKISKSTVKKAVDSLTAMSGNEIKALKLREAQKILAAVRQEVKSRMASLEAASTTKSGKKSPTFYSAEQEFQKKWEQSHTESLKKSPSRVNKADANAELQRYAKFLRSDSSTVSGARKIMRDQDARIFGTDESGRPLQRLTSKQRENFWSLYDEFLTGESTASLGYLRYSSLQQEIGKYIKDRPKKRDPKTGKFLGFDLGQAISDLKKILEADDYDTSDESILTGGRID